ncbi:MAG: magnesium-translocating P-type ATPase [Clostridia bacterium]|nr:magnesium-translocating P-type ATPase [Clostridia bacterium]
MQETKKQENLALDMYGQECTLKKEEFMQKYNVKQNGLSNEDVENLLQKLGYNEIKQAKPKHWYNYFFSSLFSPFNAILLGIVFILIYTDVLLPETPSYANIIVIIVLVLTSTFLEFFEEYRSNKAAEKLKEMVATTTLVFRNGKEEKVPIREVAIGDIVKLSAGSMIPADLRVIESKDLYVGQSSLTGESDAVKKQVETDITLDEIDNISDLENICFMGTNVISGSATGVVIKTADSTYFGKVANTITTGKPKTSFQKGIESISKLLIRFMVVLIPIVFVLNAWKHDNLTAFTFAVAIAIGITPLLLPVILSSCLSKGAVRMSKKKTIVKKLDSIQSLGGMNILCTDKTGTLTEDKIVLEKYLDIRGNEDTRVLKHAFLNAFFQTGLKSNMDEAVIDRGLKNGMSEFESKYKKIDEIPFDFNRRRLSVVVTDGTKKQMITKGAVEEILSICTMVDYQGQVSTITKEIKENIRTISKALNKEGLRVVAVCQKNDINSVENFDVSEEKNMVLMGFIGFLDPPKESAKESIEKLNKAGIRVIVLTGDNADISRCVCDKVGIHSKNIVLGSQIERLPDMAVRGLLKKTNIFAKLSPIQKARIVRLLKESGNVVGYMGDGINDSPSLTNSDVGISVDTAVDIAKESADIILLEKDLNVLLDGVRERKKDIWKFNEIYKNGCKF